MDAPPRNLPLARFHTFREVAMLNFEVQFLYKTFKSLIIKALSPFDLLLALTPQMSLSCLLGLWDR